jgi:hypothetical protein
LISGRLQDSWDEVEPCQGQRVESSCRAQETLIETPAIVQVVVVEHIG